MVYSVDMGLKELRGRRGTRGTRGWKGSKVTRGMRQTTHRSGAGIKYQPENDYMETWTFFYLRRLSLFARLSYYFTPCLRLTKSSTLLPTQFPVSTQQVSIESLKMLLIYFSQNGHFWNGVTRGLRRMRGLWRLRCLMWLTGLRGGGVVAEGADRTDVAFI